MKAAWHWFITPQIKPWVFVAIVVIATVLRAVFDG